MESNIIRLNTSQRRQQPQRLAKAKRSYTTRCLPNDLRQFQIDSGRGPKSGDVVLAKVKRLGQHKRIELINGRRARMFVDDDLVVVYGNRYAPDQFEAIVPQGLGACHLVAAGGIASQMIYKHDAMKRPTEIEPVGVLVHANGDTVNLKDFATHSPSASHPLPPVIAVVGGSMNTGKTTAVASIVHGLTLAGFKVNAGKVTGTGSGCDAWHILDAGARRVLDFLDAGYPSTYLLSPSQVQGIFRDLVSQLNEDQPDFIILEAADGLFQTETADLVTSNTFKETVSGVLYTAANAMGAVHGVEMLHRWEIPVFAVSGVLSRSPLGVRETLDAVDIPVMNRKALAAPTIEQHIAMWLGTSASADLAGGGNG